jgi:hypothetical protein
MIRYIRAIKFKVYGIVDQVYVLPSLKITHSRMLNGNLELILGWLKYELVISI